jgi:hypothetical protein
MNAMVAKRRNRLCDFWERGVRFSQERRMKQDLRQMVRDYLERLRSRKKGKPQEPEDPHSYVTAPKKPRPHQGSAAAVADLEE